MSKKKELQWSNLRTFGCCLFPLPRISLSQIFVWPTYLLHSGPSQDCPPSEAPSLTRVFQAHPTLCALQTLLGFSSQTEPHVSLFQNAPFQLGSISLEILDSCPQRIILFIRREDASLRRQV